MGSTLRMPLSIGSATVRNRLYRAPVLEGAGDGDKAVDVYSEAFVANATAGVGLIIQGSSCVLPEGRTSPGMTLVDSREKVLRLAPVVDAVHEAGASIFLQLGHGGIWSMETWHEPYASQRRGPLLAASPLPRLLRPAFSGVPVHVMTTDDVHQLAARFGDSAAWAREAGYDGVQLGSANAKLIDQFLSPFYNRRPDEFGGSLENRARILRAIRDAIAERAGADYACTVKIPSEKAPPGMARASMDDCLRMCRLAEEWGFHAVTPVEVSVFPDTTLSRGGIPRSVWNNAGVRRRLERAAPSRWRRWVIEFGYLLGGIQSPFRPVWNRHLFQAARREVSIPVFAVGGIRTTAEVEQILDGGEADMVGIGRPFYAEPDLAARVLEGDPGPRLCRNSNLCVPPQMLGMKGVCYNPDVRRAASSRPRP
jgi:2,4-dienoyl-CoA reductase-like NADH-dependent reductase (Old Yellow Enzyme family)